ncbi:MAG: hypothetical protein COC22_04280 [Flavobacteriaceae bacterium]|nr:MAG: hypothetical protein COC22_04280 [Flavobacteriaceae bacterium]
MQEYNVWEKTATSITGELTKFNNEKNLSFTPENITRFYSSQDEVGTNIAIYYWDYVGDY